MSGDFRTLLVYPPFHRLHALKNRFYPIGLGYLAGALKEAGYPAAIYNGENHGNDEDLGDGENAHIFEQFAAYQEALDNPDHYVWREARRIIEQYRPHMVGLTVKSCMIPSARVITDMVKEIDPSITVVWGGPHPSISADETIRFSGVDVVVRHEGERTIVELAERLAAGRKDLGDIDGLVWNNHGLITHNQNRGNEEDIDRIPFPDKSADLMPERYEPDHYGVMFTSRGCPWPCTFCDSKGVWTRKLRYRSHENILEEMDALYNEQGVRAYYYWDDTFTPNKKYSAELFDKMSGQFQDQQRPITWRATTRCDCVDDELMAKMKASGCRLITYGIETGSPSMMKILKKGITHEKVFHAQKVMQKAKVDWEAFFMIGFPDDTPETIEETMDLIERIDAGSSISIFTPYPGTEMYDLAKSYGLIDEPIEWKNFSHQSPRNHFVKSIDRETFHSIADDCLRRCDKLRLKHYYRGRLHHYASNPRAAAGKLVRMLTGAA